MQSHSLPLLPAAAAHRQFGLSIRKTFPPMAKAACLSYAPGRHGQHKRGRETRKCKKPFRRSAYPYRQRIPQDSNLSKPASQAGIAEGENSIMSNSASRSTALPAHAAVIPAKMGTVGVEPMQLSHPSQYPECALSPAHCCDSFASEPTGGRRCYHNKTPGYLLSSSVLGNRTRVSISHVTIFQHH